MKLLLKLRSSLLFLPSMGLVLALLVFSSCSGITSASSSCTENNPLKHASDSNLLQLASTDTTNDGYLKWVTNTFEDNYTNSLFISTTANACVGMSFHWKINVQTRKISIAAAFPKSSSWGGIGFSETGGMRGADIVYFNTIDSTLVDSYVKDGYVKPTPDDVNNWALIRSSITTDDEYLIFEAERKLDTGDSRHDWPIVNDSSPLIADHQFLAAWGDNASGEIAFHSGNRVKTAIQLFPIDGSTPGSDPAGSAYDNFIADMAEYSDGDFEILMEDQYDLTTTVTVYEEQCHPESKVGSLLSLGSTDDYRKFIVGLEWIIPENDREYMHHMVLYGLDGNRNLDRNDCSLEYQMATFAWAPGDDFVYFPPGTGIPFGSSNTLHDINAFIIQYHIDNANRVTGPDKFVKGSGVKVYYTNTPPENEIGTFEIGDPQVLLNGVRVGEGYSKHDFTCDEACSNKFLTNTDITIISEGLHMHATGKRMVNQVIRNDEVVHEASTDYYDFIQMGAVRVQQEPYQFKKGDTFRSRCYYNSGPNDVFGLGSEDEMCITFIMYYPRITDFNLCGLYASDSSCRVSYTKKSLSNEEELNRTFGRDGDPLPSDDDGNSGSNHYQSLLQVFITIVATVTMIYY